MNRVLVWFRRDLRIKDQHAFARASVSVKEVVPVFIIDETIVHHLPKDDRRISFIQGCLDELSQQLENAGGQLGVFAGDPIKLIPKLALELKVDAVFCNHDYEPDAKARDQKIAQLLQKSGIQFHSFKDQVIFDRQEILNGSQKPYRVFTPYSRAWIKKLESDSALHLLEHKSPLKSIITKKRLQSLISERSTSFWDLGFVPQALLIPPGEVAAQKALKAFAASISAYHQQRDFPALDGTSQLSTHFRFGTVSIRQAVRFCKENFSAGSKVWLTELIWREFYQMILDQYPHVVGHSFRPEYDSLKWSGKNEHFKAWCEGRTGYPIVDAAMRQLNETGWMHNRLRMITAMFLTKDLLVDWRKGEAYFALKLLDFDLASNNGGWQWSASTGCDAQPYFRIMNPVSQSERFDPDGTFIRKFVPELKKVVQASIHWPHDRGLSRTDMGGYPAPIVEHKVQREKALKLFKEK